MNILYHIPGDACCNADARYVHGAAKPGSAKSEAIWSSLTSHCAQLGDYLSRASPSGDEECGKPVPTMVLASSARRSMDIVGASSTHTAAFTKSYGKSCGGGSGSVFASLCPSPSYPIARDPPDTWAGALGLRLFSPREIATLHGIPDTFMWPPSLTTRQKYALLGNSLSVTVASAALRYMISPEFSSSEG